MPALGAPHETFEKAGIVLAYKLGPSAIYKGALVGLTAAGAPAPLLPDEPMRFLGVSAESADGAKRHRFVNVAKLGSFVFGCVGFAPSTADLGRLVYAASDWQVSLSPDELAYPVPVGTIVGIEKTKDGGDGVRIRIDLHTV